jgi:hypothetical protein
MSRIELNDNYQDIVIKLSEGNPGAITALMQLSGNYEDIDPDSAFGPISPMISFDSYDVYGSEIYIIWNDKCNRDSYKTILLLRAVQLGILPLRRFKEMAEDQMREVNLTNSEWEDINKKVCDQLPGFKKTT